MNMAKCAGTASLYMLVCLSVVPCRADSAVSLLSGFDAERIEATYPPINDDAAGELAKLVYRLRKVDANALSEKVGSLDNASVGDAVLIEGQIEAIASLRVPSRLVEFLELTTLQVLTVAMDTSKVRVVTAEMPTDAQPGDRVTGASVVISSEELPGEFAVATGRLRWFPKSPESIGWKLLGKAGVDVSMLAEVGERNRRPLLPADGDAFYSILSAAGSMTQSADLPVPTLIDPVTLLREPDDLSGQWVRMDLETVQITRISVTEPQRRSQLGRDHYFQIDAIGDLGNVIIRLEPNADSGGTAATFENRYPVSIVAIELPSFLRDRIRAEEGGDAIVSQVKMMVSVNAFFYRLWSYESDYMKQFGSGEQFGPLLIAANIRNREPTSNDPAGVGIIGWIAAAAVLMAIVATWMWNRRLAAGDDQVRNRRKAREAEKLQLPDL